MICGTFTMRNVPADELDATIEIAKANQPPPNSVTSQPDGNGTFTIITVYPPCPTNLEHATGSAED